MLANFVNDQIAISYAVNESLDGSNPVTSNFPHIVLIGSLYPAVPSGRTCQYTSQLQNPAGNPLGSATLNTLKLTLVDVASGAIVNDVDQVDILNTGRGTIDVNGNLVVTLGSVPNTGDTALLNSEDSQEQRSIILDWTYSTDTQAGARQIDFLVVALDGP